MILNVFFWPWGLGWDTLVFYFMIYDDLHLVLALARSSTSSSKRHQILRLQLKQPHLATDHIFQAVLPTSSKFPNVCRMAMPCNAMSSTLGAHGTHPSQWALSTLHRLNVPCLAGFLEEIQWHKVREWQLYAAPKWKSQGPYLMEAQTLQIKCALIFNACSVLLSL